MAGLSQTDKQIKEGTPASKIVAKKKPYRDLDLSLAIHPIRKDIIPCLLYTSPSPRDKRQSRMPSSA